MISLELKKLCEEILKTENYIKIANEVGLSFGYIKDIKNRLRHNPEVELLLKSELKKELSEKMELYELIDSL